MAAEIAADQSLAASAFPEIGSHTTPRSWAEEGYALAKEYAYLNGTLPFSDYDAFDKKQLSAEQVPLLPEEYQRNARELAKRLARHSPATGSPPRSKSV